VKLITEGGGFVADVEPVIAALDPKRLPPGAKQVLAWGTRLFVHEAGDIWRETLPLVVREVSS
jgi:hypothetical protein